MTYREKMKIEHPNLVGAQFIGGCKGCPEPENSKRKCNSNGCAACWDKAIPEKMTLTHKLMIAAIISECLMGLITAFTLDNVFSAVCWLFSAICLLLEYEREVSR